MSHYRQQIRDALAQVLVDANTGAGANVFTSRARPVLEIMQKREKVLSVYTSEESSERSGDGYTYRRELTVSIEGMAGGGDDLDDALDDLAAEVEAAVVRNPMLGNLLSEELVLDSTVMEITARGNMQVGAFRMDFVCAYVTERQMPHYLPGDDEGEVIVPPPVPTSISVSPEPTPYAYAGQLDAAVGPAELPPAEVLNGDLTLKPAQPPEPTESPCEDGSCDLPVWQGDTTDEGYTPPPPPPEPTP